MGSNSTLPISLLCPPATHWHQRVQETYKAPAIAVRDMLSQDGAIVTVYAPKVEKEDVFLRDQRAYMQVDCANQFRRQCAEKLMELIRLWCSPRVMSAGCVQAWL